MKASRFVALLVLLALLGFAFWYLLLRPNPGIPTMLSIYYTKVDGSTLAVWTISHPPHEPGESAAQYVHDTVLYAAVQTVAGPPSDVQAIRFPPGTHVIAVAVDGTTADVDLSNDVTHQRGEFGENGEFKALVYTVTAIDGIKSVQISVGGRRLTTLPGGNFELDTPLMRSDW